MRFFGIALGVLLVPLSACSDASGESRGGEDRFDASPPSPPTSASDAGSGGGITWTDLYRDFFGPTGNANCSLEGTCHGAANQSGALSSNFVCPADKAGCYEGLKTGGLITPGDGTNRALTAILRKASGGGTMPKRPQSRSFSAGEIDRVNAWIQAGANND